MSPPGHNPLIPEAEHAAAPAAAGISFNEAPDHPQEGILRLSLGAIGIVYRTREDALAAYIPVKEEGCPTMNVAKVYYDWDGYSKLTPELVDAINAVVSDKACLMTPWVWYEATSRGSRGLSSGGQRGPSIGANVAHERSSEGGGKRNVWLRQATRTRRD